MGIHIYSNNTKTEYTQCKKTREYGNIYIQIIIITNYTKQENT